MGSHSVPQYYLRAFEDPRHPGMIWAYPREGPVRLLPIKNVAQSSGFYDPNVEVALHELVEVPANPVLSLLRDSRPIDPEGKRTLAIYIATLLKRVPHSRARAKALVPETLANTVSELEQKLISLGQRPGVAPGLLERRLQELEVAHEKLAREIPPEVVAQIEDPWPSSRTIDAIRQMHWKILIAVGAETFLTSDNPAFFFRAYGVGTEKAELNFPISPRRCLHGDHHSKSDEVVTFLTPEREIVREMNRRIASEVTTFAFSSKKLTWPPKLLRKKNPYLSRIRWGP